MWQPIETAPKDGTRILVYGGDGYAVIDLVSWQWPGEWCRDQTAEYENDGMFVSKPSHWQPLPATPKEPA